MMKKVIALVLAMVLGLSLFTGCTDSSDNNTDNQTATGIDYTAAFEQYDPNTVVMTINGETVTWSEFYYMMSYAASQLQYYLGEMEWDEECMEGTGITFGEYCMTLTMDSLKQFHAISAKSADMGLVLTAEDMETIAAQEEAFKLQVCGADATEEQFLNYLMEELFLTEDVYQYINENAVMYEKLFVETVGENGAKLTDEEISTFVAEHPYITAKHILIKTIDANYQSLPEEELKAAKSKAEKILRQLQGIKDPDQLEKKFDELMNEFSEDEGLVLFTDGYTFTTGEMMEEFETTAFNLPVYGLSELVETEVGYHIILRIPTERNSLVDYDYETGSVYTIVYYAATNIFSKLMTAWMDECEVVWESDFEGITAEQIFG